MLENCHDAQERWGGVHRLLDRWLQERQALVCAYIEVKQAATPAQLESFCNRLMDYLSAGHFEIYEQLLAEAEAFDDQPAVALAEQLYPRIQNSTRHAVDFNDRYAGQQAPAATLVDDLQQLGQGLRERFELEDCLIEVLHNAHRQADPA